MVPALFAFRAEQQGHPPARVSNIDRPTGEQRVAEQQQNAESQQGQQQGGASAGTQQQGADTSAQQQGQQSAEPMIPKSRFDEINNRLKEAERREAQAERERQAAADAAAAEQGKFRELAEQRAAKLAETENALRRERTASAILRAATEAHFPVDVAERMVDVEYDAAGQITTDIPAAIKTLAEKYPQLISGQNGTNGQTARPGNNGSTQRPAGSLSRDELVQQEKERLRAGGGYGRLG